MIDASIPEPPIWSGVEGPYQRVGQWMGEMADFVATKGKQVQHLYTYYTTCPKCAKTYGKNYVVLLAQVG